jgi:hypothetical protein
MNTLHSPKKTSFNADMSFQLDMDTDHSGLGGTILYQAV